MMHDAKIVPTSADEPDADQTMLVRRKGSRNTLFVILFLTMVGASIAFAYGLFGTGDAAAVAPDASQIETKADTPAVSTAAALPAVCQGDLSQASDQLKWYCNGFSPWKQAVDAKLTRLDERGTSVYGTSTMAWILILVLGANSFVTWIMLLRRRKPSS